MVRVTARISASAFVAALIVFAIRGGNSVRVTHALRFFGAFVLAHTIHFGAVVWLAVITASENIRARGGWPLMLLIATLFYLACFAILRAWTYLAVRRALSRGHWSAAHAGVVLIALIFLNSYVARVGAMPIYWVPALVMIAAVIAYLSSRGGRAIRSRTA